MSSTTLTHFDVETEEEINAELVGRNIELMNVVNVETIEVPFDGDEDDCDEMFRVWYWYVSELIT